MTLLVFAAGFAAGAFVVFMVFSVMEFQRAMKEINDIFTPE